MKQIKARKIARLPLELVHFLRHNSGGAQAPAKGKHAKYNRGAEKTRVRRELQDV